MQKHCILGYPKCAQWRFWSDCANAQSDLNLRWANISGCTFSKVPPHIIINDCFQILPSFKDGVLIQDIMPQNGGKRHLAKMSVQGDELITVSSISLQAVVLLIWAPRAEQWVRTESNLGQFWRNSVVCSKAVNQLKIPTFPIQVGYRAYILVFGMKLFCTIYFPNFKFWRENIQILQS